MVVNNLPRVLVAVLFPEEGDGCASWHGQQDITSPVQGLSYTAPGRIPAERPHSQSLINRFCHTN